MGASLSSGRRGPGGSSEAPRPEGAPGDCRRPVAAPDQRLMTALKPRAPARRSCLAGDSRPVEGLEGRAEGARSWMHERAGSGAGLSSPRQRRAHPAFCKRLRWRAPGLAGGLLYSASAASLPGPSLPPPLCRPVLSSLRAEPSAWKRSQISPISSAPRILGSSVPMVESRSLSRTEINQTNLSPTRPLPPLPSLQTQVRFANQLPSESSCLYTRHLSKSSPNSDRKHFYHYESSRGWGWGRHSILQYLNGNWLKYSMWLFSR